MARWTLAVGAGFVILYCLVSIGYVATAPDIGLRCVLHDDDLAPGIPGPRIRAVVPNLSGVGELPVAGDQVVTIARQPVPTFLHFCAAVSRLRGGPLPGAPSQYEASDLAERSNQLPPVVDLGDGRYVEVTYWSSRRKAIDRAWLAVGSVPVDEVIRTCIWFLLELGMFLVGAVAFWKRPFDRQSRLFFAMSTVTIGAFVGGFHWWVIAATPWLVIPFTICGILLAPVTLHFFLIYPQPLPFFDRTPARCRAALYALPGTFVVGIVSLTAVAWWVLATGGSSEEAVGSIARLMQGLDHAIFAYFTVAAVYYALTLAALVHSFFSVRNPILRNQVKWILWAGFVATVPVGYVLQMALLARLDFALGASSTPMFVASLLFMVAYTVGIVRYKLMQIEEVVTRGMLYYVVRVLLKIAFGLLWAGVCWVGMSQGTLFPHQAIPLGATIVCLVVLLSWLAESLGSTLDRYFRRETYQIERALQPLQAADTELHPETISQRILASCTDVLEVEWAALYLRDDFAGQTPRESSTARKLAQPTGTTNATPQSSGEATDAAFEPAGVSSFRLASVHGNHMVPLQLAGEDAKWAVLQSDRSVRRTSENAPSRTELQAFLSQVDADLAQGLVTDGRLAGVLLIGPRRGGAAYSPEDFAFLSALGQISSVALQSAKVHRAVAHLSDQLRVKMEKIAEQQQLITLLQTEVLSRQTPTTNVVSDPFRRELIVGHSPAVVRVLETTRKVAASESSVLIRGESGTGKELLARTLHENSPRKEGPLVSVHCGALAAGLLESELFGHVKGAFTGAHRDRPGRFEAANGGTLFLDEIGDVPLETQVKLLRVLQERRFEPVGDSRSIAVDVRLIAATHRNLEELIAEGKFREDLFYRLNVITLALPPLREREDDVLELALAFLVKGAERTGKRLTHFDSAALQKLRDYPWPGNIRELQNAIERAVVLADGPAILVDDLPPSVRDCRSRESRDSVRAASRLAGTIFSDEPRGANGSRFEAATDGERSLRETPGGNGGLASGRPMSGGGEPVGGARGGLRNARPVSAGRRRGEPREITADDAAERETLLAALHQCDGNKAEAARLLGLPRSTYFSKLRRHGIE